LTKVQKSYIHEAAKKTIIGQQKALTPRLAVLFLDSDRRNKTIEARRQEKEN